MKKNIQLYHLYGDRHTTPLPDFVHCETIASRSKAYNWEIKPHVHAQLYQVFLMESGAGFLQTESGNLAFATPCLITMPATRLHGFTYSEPTDGRVLTLSESYLDVLFEASPKVNLSLNQLRVVPVSIENAAIFNDLIQIVDTISAELYDDLSEKNMALNAYLSLFFIKIHRFLHKNTFPQEIMELKTAAHLSANNAHILRGGDNRQLQHFQAFQKSIRKSLSATKTITAYAQELNITTVHLNRICQTIAQKTASEIIEAILVAEAQKYLKHTSYSISEISYMLDFNDPAYFSRVFKKQTGQSPKIYRQIPSEQL
jgi:AraC family transcriptional regulator, transcriptional activator of pobA